MTLVALLQEMAGLAEVVCHAARDWMLYWDDTRDLWVVGEAGTENVYYYEEEAAAVAALISQAHEEL